MLYLDPERLTNDYELLLDNIVYLKDRETYALTLSSAIPHNPRNYLEYSNVIWSSKNLDIVYIKIYPSMNSDLIDAYRIERQLTTVKESYND